MYRLLEQAHKSNLKIPAQCLTEEYSFETNRVSIICTSIICLLTVMIVERDNFNWTDELQRRLQEHCVARRALANFV